MTREAFERMKLVTDENEARQLAEVWLEEFRVHFPSFPALDLLREDLRWAFANEDLNFRQIAMWAGIAAELKESQTRKRGELSD